LGLRPLANPGHRRRPHRSGVRRRLVLVDPPLHRRSLPDAEARAWLSPPRRDRERRRRSHSDRANRCAGVRRHPGALLRYQHEVRAGQLCAKIDPRPFQVVVDEASANLAAAAARLKMDKVDLAHAKAALERHEALSKRRAISRKALANSRRAYERARTQLKLDEATAAQLEAALHVGEINLSYTDIVSPIDGTVVLRDVAIGQTATAGPETAPLFLVAADLTVVRVDANVSKNDIGEVKLGDKATFTVGSFPSRPFHGTVTQIGLSPQTIQNVVTYDVVITASNPDLLLEPGMTTTATIVVDRRDDSLRAPD